MKSHFNVREYWEDRLGKDYSIRGVGHKGYGKYFNHWMYLVRKLVVQRTLKKLNSSPLFLKALDIGSGTGFYIEILNKFGIQDITGIDITSVAVRHLKERYPKNKFMQVDISEETSAEKLGIEQYDMITAFDVLFHIVDDASYQHALTNISRCLKKGGYLLFSDNFLHDRTSRASHQVSRPLDNISHILKCVDLHVVERVPMFIFMNTPVDVKSAFWTKLWITFMLPVRLVNILGLFYGMIIFPVELLMVSIFRESPTTEMMVCRKQSPIIADGSLSLKS